MGHKEEVMRLYRASLKLMMNWAVEPRIIRMEHQKIRKMFEDGRRGDPSLVLSGWKTLAKNRHPDPYIAPPAEGGSKWQRNTAFGAEPLETAH